MCKVDIVRIGTYIEQCVSLVFLFWGEVGKFRSPRVVPRERVRSPKFESRRGKLLRDGCACAARVKLGMRKVRRVHLTDIWSWYRVELRRGDHLGRSEELVSRCVECDLAEPESLVSGVVDGILSGIKREITEYPSLKDERYFDGFKRSLFIVAKTLECSDVLDPNYTPGSEPEEQQLFEA